MLKRLLTFDALCMGLFDIFGRGWIIKSPARKNPPNEPKVADLFVFANFSWAWKLLIEEFQSHDALPPPSPPRGKVSRVTCMWNVAKKIKIQTFSVSLAWNNHGINCQPWNVNVRHTERAASVSFYLITTYKRILYIVAGSSRLVNSVWDPWEKTGSGSNRKENTRIWILFCLIPTYKIIHK